MGVKRLNVLLYTNWNQIKWCQIEQKKLEEVKPHEQAQSISFQAWSENKKSKGDIQISVNIMDVHFALPDQGLYHIVIKPKVAHKEK